MKARFLLLAVMAVMMAFTGCTKEKIVYVEKENDLPNSEMQLEGNVLRISLSSGLSRAARPIYDGSADNNINRIGLKFLNQSGAEISGITIEKVEADNYVLDDNEEGYTNNIIKIYNVDGDREEPNQTPADELSIHLNMEVAKNQYIRIIAYGYNEGSTGDTFPTYTIENGNNIDGYVLGLESVTNDNVQEYFAGYVDTGVNAFGLFNESPKITLDRQVAGLLVYLEKIPVRVNKTDNNPVKVCYITVNAAKNISGLLIPASAMMNDRLLGDDNNSNYANGFTLVEEHTVLMEFDLTGTGINDKGTFYEFPQNADVGGIFTENKVLFAEGMDASQFSGKNFANHTLFGSCFILPFNHATYSPGDEYNTALYINYLAQDESVISTVNLELSAATEPRSYAIWANHFYSIGTKIGDADVDTDKDGYPDDGEGHEDDPLDISDLSGTKILKLTVNDTWEDVSLIRPKN